MSEIKKEHTTHNKEHNLENLLTKLTLLFTNIQIRISKTLKTLGDVIIARINQRNELKQIENEAYKEELTELTVKRHNRAIELAKERGKQKAHGKKHKSKLTQEQQKAIKTRRKQLGQISMNLSSLIGASNQPKKEKTKVELKDEIEHVKLEHQLVELKKKPKN